MGRESRIGGTGGMNDHQKKQASCTCLTPERRDYIQSAMDFADDFSDAAFMAYLEERGIDVSELEAFSIEHECSKAEAL